jgi:hypothetical protein
MAGETASLSRPRVHRSPLTGAGTLEPQQQRPFDSARSGRARAAAGPFPAAASLTDIYLRRSYALVERLRQAVAERAAESG